MMDDTYTLKPHLLMGKKKIDLLHDNIMSLIPESYVVTIDKK